MLYLIGLGLNEKNLCLEALEICKKADEFYLENYTVNFPYNVKILEKIINKKIILADRKKIESEILAEYSKNKDIVLFVYGSPLVATTHVSLLLKCIKEKIIYKIIQNSSIFDAITETGLQIYKFGKTASLPKWQKNYEPKSFIEIIKENQQIKAHSLLLVDIDLELKEAIKQLKKTNYFNFHKQKIVLCSCLGTKKARIYYDYLKKIENKRVKKPFCFLILSELHFSEKEFLEKITEK